MALAIAAPLFLIGWDTATVLTILHRAPALITNELWLYLAAKSSFVIFLCVILTATGRWRRFGFDGGLAWRFWWALLPALVSAFLSALHGLPVEARERIYGWLLLGLMIAFGEETVFRGFILDILAPWGPRTAIIVSGCLFGLSHLVGVSAGIDWHMVVGQTVFATGIGWSFGWVRLASRSIWPGVIAHAAMDGLGLTAADGVGQAMHYVPKDFYALAAMAAFSFAWGLMAIAKPVRDQK